MSETTSWKVIPLTGTEKYTRLLKDGVDTVRMKSGYVVLQPGESVGEHSTEGKEEILVVLEGEAALTIEKKPAVKVPRQYVIYIPPQTLHNVENAGCEVLRYLFIVSR